MIKIQRFYWHIMVYCLIVNVVAEECYVVNEDEAGNKLICVNAKGNKSIQYNETVSNITQILIFKLDMTSISTNFFDKFDKRQIRILTLSHGNLSSVDETSFSSLTELNHLNLSFNRITSISEKAFVRNSKLKAISLMANQIRELETNIFATLVDLESIDLTRNFLTKLNKHLFLNNRNLVLLDVKFNNLTDISSVIFHGLPLLNTLDLSYNKIESISPHIFKYNYALRRINLQGNRIKTLEFALSHLGLEELNLLGNPLNMTDKKNQQVLKELKSSHVDVNIREYSDQNENKSEDKDLTKQVIFEMSTSLKLILSGIMTLLVVILITLSFLLYFIYQRKVKTAYKEYYQDKSKSTDCLQEDVDRYLQLSVSDGNVLFHNAKSDDLEDHEDSCSCASCLNESQRNTNT